MSRSPHHVQPLDRRAVKRNGELWKEEKSHPVSSSLARLCADGPEAATVQEETSSPVSPSQGVVGNSDHQSNLDARSSQVVPTMQLNSKQKVALVENTPRHVPHSRMNNDDRVSGDTCALDELMSRGYMRKIVQLRVRKRVSHRQIANFMTSIITESKRQNFVGTESLSIFDPKFLLARASPAHRPETSML